MHTADAAIITLALTSDTVSLRQMSDLADTLIAQRMSTISGVGHVSVEGGIKPAVRIQADLSRLASYSLSMTDLRNAIIRAYREMNRVGFEARGVARAREMTPHEFEQQLRRAGLPAEPVHDLLGAPPLDDPPDTRVSRRGAPF